MKYLAKLWLSDRGYLAVLDVALVIVTVDEKKNPVRWNIFRSNAKLSDSDQKEIINELATLNAMK